MNQNAPKIAILVLTLLFVAWVFIIPSERHLEFKIRKINSFSDPEEGGNSTISLSQRIPEIHYQYELKPGIEYPYVGVSFSQTDSTKNCANWSDVQSISYKIYSEKSGLIALDVKTWDQERTQVHEELSYRMLRKEIQLKAGLNELNLPIEHFKIPDWLRKLQKLDNLDENRFMSEVCILDFAHGDMGQGPNQIKVQQITLHYDYYGTFWWVLSAYLIALIASVLMIKRSILKARIQSKLQTNRNQAKAEIRSLETPSEWPPVVEWMKLNFEDSELNLDKASQGVGLSNSKLTSLIKSQTSLSFKAFLNDLRMERAQQLLEETDEQVLQIALNCGYNTVAHFNRLFKERVGKSPTAWRKEIRAQSSS